MGAPATRQGTKKAFIIWQLIFGLFCNSLRNVRCWDLFQLRGPPHFPLSHTFFGQPTSICHPMWKLFCNFETQIWLEIITSRDAKSACFKGSRTSCREIIFGIFWPNFGQKRSHHVMDASCEFCNSSCSHLLPDSRAVAVIWKKANPDVA